MDKATYLIYFDAMYLGKEASSSTQLNSASLHAIFLFLYLLLGYMDDISASAF